MEPPGILQEAILSNNLVNLRQLRHVVVLARAGSFVRAARELNLSASALSRSIQATEVEMNVVLFSRGKGGVFPTPAGTKVIHAARTLLESAADFQRLFTSRAQRELGEVVFGMSPMPSCVTLHPLFVSLLDRCDMRVRVHIQSGERMLELLNAGVLEFFVCEKGGFTSAPHVNVEEIATFDLTALVRAGHPLAGIEGVTREQFHAFPHVGAPADIQLQIEGFQYDPLIEGDSYHIFAGLLRSTDAVGIFPATFEAPGLVPLRCQPGIYPERFPVVLVRPRLTSPSLAGSRLISEMKKIVPRVATTAASGPAPRSRSRRK